MWAPQEGADSAASVLGRLWKDLPLRIFIAIMNYGSNDFNKGIDVQLLVIGSVVVATLLELDPRGGYINNDELESAFDIAAQAQHLQVGFAQEAEKRPCTPQELNALLAFKLRVMVNHVRIKKNRN